MPSLGENYLPRIVGIPKHVSFVLMEGALPVSLGVSGGQQQPECRRSHVWGVPGTSKDRDSRVCPGGVLRNGEVSVRSERTLDGTQVSPDFKPRPLFVGASPETFLRQPHPGPSGTGSVSRISEI